MTVGEVGRVRASEDQRPDVPMAGRSGDEAVAERVRGELALGEEELLADPAEDVVGELVGPEQIAYGLVDPDVDRDVALRHLGVADEVDTLHAAEDMLDVEREAKVSLVVLRPLLAEPRYERLNHIVHT